MSLLRLDIATAEMLAAMLIAEIHGSETLAEQQPLDVVDLGETILVKGIPREDPDRGLSFCSSHVTFAKDDAEVLDFGRDGRLTLSQKQAEHWRKLMSPDEFETVFGPRRNYDLDQKSASMWLFTAINGGLLKADRFVTKYAAILLKHAWRVSRIEASSLHAVEVDMTWHIGIGTATRNSKVVQLSKLTGRVLQIESRPPE